MRRPGSSVGSAQWVKVLRCSVSAEGQWWVFSRAKSGEHHCPGWSYTFAASRLFSLLYFLLGPVPLQDVSLGHCKCLTVRCEDGLGRKKPAETDMSTSPSSYPGLTPAGLRYWTLSHSLSLRRGGALLIFLTHSVAWGQRVTPKDNTGDKRLSPNFPWLRVCNFPARLQIHRSTLSLPVRVWGCPGVGEGKQSTSAWLACFAASFGTTRPHGLSRLSGAFL